MTFDRHVQNYICRGLGKESVSPDRVPRAEEAFRKTSFLLPPHTELPDAREPIYYRNHRLAKQWTTYGAFDHWTDNQDSKTACRWEIDHPIHGWGQSWLRYLLGEKLCRT